LKACLDAEPTYNPRMAEKPLLPGFQPRKFVWKKWKWIGLVLFAVVLLASRWLPGVVVFVGWLYGIIVLLNLLLHGSRYMRDRLFWRVRYRLASAFVFVGLIPIVLLLGTLYVAVEIAAGQLASDYFRRALEDLQTEITWINVELGQQPGMRDGSGFKSAAAAVLGSHAREYPVLAARLMKRSKDGAYETVDTHDPAGLQKNLAPYRPDLWTGRGDSGFQGILRFQRTLFMSSIRAVPGSDQLFIEVAAPFDVHAAQRLEQLKSIYVTIVGVGRTTIRKTARGTQIEIKDDAATTEAEARVVAAPRTKDTRRMISWGTFLECLNVESASVAPAAGVILQVPLETLYRTYLAGNLEVARIMAIALAVLAGLFLLAELVSLLIGITISRKITGSVHDIYEGTMALQGGDLQHRIPVRRNDQLGLLAHSFNQMSASITRLLEEVSEKKRLEQELEIAREVQATLFPKQLPHPRGLSVYGGCEPARVVSGDYYDFVVEDDARLHIVVGDISGKGISAALLMANLQAAMRNQLMSFKQENPIDVERGLSAVMRQLNEQIYQNSPSEKYATLFSSLYNAETRRLYYCNAGHLAPMLLIDHSVQRLESGGTVLGLFPTAEYQAASVQLQPGAVLAVFTDGVTEAVNENDEEFGEERLVEALRECRHQGPDATYHQVVQRVRDWQGSLKQHDDITLIVAKVE
jgi:serine phosphatase RsbU (regulator of sigma subunit)